MKVQLAEHSGCFEISLEPETPKEVAQLVRLGVNGTKEVRAISTTVGNDLSVNAWLVLGKRKQPRSQVAPGRW